MHPAVGCYTWVAYQRLLRGEPVGDLIRSRPWLAKVTDPRNRTLLFVAVKLGRPEAVAALVSCGANINHRDHSGAYPIDEHAPPYIQEAAGSLVWF